MSLRPASSVVEHQHTLLEGNSLLNLAARCGCLKASEGRDGLGWAGSIQVDGRTDCIERLTGSSERGAHRLPPPPHPNNADPPPPASVRLPR